MTKEAIVVVVVVLLLLLFSYWHPRSTVLKWSVLVTVVFVGMAAFRYISN
jgi:protein-S-isoprenylcysteine O-methyltransferase Ste14